MELQDLSVPLLTSLRSATARIDEKEGQTPTTKAEYAKEESKAARTHALPAALPESARVSVTAWLEPSAVVTSNDSFPAL